MEGKGWFIIYGVLLLLVIGLWFAQVSEGARVKQLQTDIAALKSQQGTQPTETQTPEPDVSSSSSPTAQPTPDLSTAANRDKERKANLETISGALDAFHQEKHAYPKALTELAPKYIPKVPTDPLAPKYSYRYQRTTFGFRLTSILETKNDPDDAKDGKRDQIYTVTEKTQ